MSLLPERKKGKKGQGRKKGGKVGRKEEEEK